MGGRAVEYRQIHGIQGLLGTAVRAYVGNLRARSDKPNLYIVPCTLSYKLVLEAETLIDDYLKEVGKSRYIIEDDEFSRLDRWIAFFRKLVGTEGACVIRFGRPLDPFGNPVDEDGSSIAPGGPDMNCW